MLMQRKVPYGWFRREYRKQSVRELNYFRENYLKLGQSVLACEDVRNFCAKTEGKAREVKNQSKEICRKYDNNPTRGVLASAIKTRMKAGFALFLGSAASLAAGIYQVVEASAGAGIALIASAFALALLASSALMSAGKIGRAMIGLTQAAKAASLLPGEIAQQAAKYADAIAKKEKRE